MPGFRGHLIFAFLFLASVLLFNSFIFQFMIAPAWYMWIIYSPLLMAMSLFPDIDTQASVARYWWTVIGLFTIIFLSLKMALQGFNLWHTIYITLIAILLIVPFFMTHRGIMHSWGMGVIIASTLLLIGSWQLFILGLFAYWSHLLIDFIMTFIDRGHVQIRFL